MQDKICDLGFAQLDLDRFRRRGFPEVIFAQGKTSLQLLEVCRQIIRNKQILLLTKLEKNRYRYLKRYLSGLKYNPLAKMGFLGKLKTQKTGYVCVVTAGTADIPVAEEAVVTLEVMGNRIKKIYDVGIAGIQRLLNKIEIIRNAKVVIVVAGMDAALASVVSGLVSSPVIAVPTSFGYGANFKGLSALLTMLNSCSAGVGVVNIDNGFGAGYLASLINR